MLINPPPATYSAAPMNRQSVSPLGIPGLQNPIGGSNSLGAGNMAQTMPVSRLPAVGSDQGMGAGPGLANPPFPHAAFPQGLQPGSPMAAFQNLQQQGAKRMGQMDWQHMGQMPQTPQGGGQTTNAMSMANLLGQGQYQ